MDCYLENDDDMASMSNVGCQYSLLFFSVSTFLILIVIYIIYKLGLESTLAKIWGKTIVKW